MDGASHPAELEKHRDSWSTLIVVVMGGAMVMIGLVLMATALTRLTRRCTGGGGSGSSRARGAMLNGGPGQDRGRVDGGGLKGSGGDPMGHTLIDKAFQETNHRQRLIMTPSKNAANNSVFSSLDRSPDVIPQYTGELELISPKLFACRDRLSLIFLPFFHYSRL